MFSRGVYATLSGEGNDAACRIFTSSGTIISLFSIAFLIANGVILLLLPTLTRLSEENGVKPEQLSVIDVLRESGSSYQFILLIGAVSLIAVIFVSGIIYLIMTARAFKRGENCMIDRSGNLIRPIAIMLLISIGSFAGLFYYMKDYIGLTAADKIKEDPSTLLLIDYRERQRSNLRDSLIGQTLKQVEEKMDITIDETKQQEIIENVLNWVKE